LGLVRLALVRLALVRLGLGWRGSGLLGRSLRCGPLLAALRAGLVGRGGLNLLLVTLLLAVLLGLVLLLPVLLGSLLVGRALLLGFRTAQHHRRVPVLPTEPGHHLARDPHGAGGVHRRGRVVRCDDERTA
jgi:hypothetical protein